MTVTGDYISLCKELEPVVFHVSSRCMFALRHYNIWSD
jgi:hypothetical protein